MPTTQRALPVLLLMLSLSLMTACGESETSSRNDERTGSAGRAEGAVEAELGLGATAPDFSLKGADANVYSLADYEDSSALAVIFTCLSCPFARAYEERIISIANDYAERGVRVVAIMPNDTSIAPGDATENLKNRSEEMNYPFPYLIDETQEVARAFGARVTPHAFLFGPDGKLIYRGRIDDSTEPEKVSTHDLRNALEAALASQEVQVGSTKAFGCTIKWSKETRS